MDGDVIGSTISMVSALQGHIVGIENTVVYYRAKQLC